LFIQRVREGTRSPEVCPLFCRRRVLSPPSLYLPHALRLADKLTLMRPRLSLLVMLCLTVAFNGTGIASAHALPGAEGVAPATHQGHSMPDMEEADCAGHETAQATNSAHAGESGEEHSGDNCCKAPSCGCGCVATSASVIPARTSIAAILVHGFVAPANIAGYVSPMLPHLVRPPILQALPAP
jgi:hypothetical protein